MMFLGPYWWLIIPGIVLGLYAQIRLSSAYSQYADVGNSAGLSGAEAARHILNRAGLSDIPVEAVPGHLTDHYDPVNRVLALSYENYEGRSIAAVGVAAHEAGHALQQQTNYPLFGLRMSLVPVVNIASMAWMFLALAGMLFHFFGLITIGIVVFSILTLFQIITLPVEFDASRRARQQLLRTGLITPEEAPAVTNVLNAAGMTYVAGMVTAALQLLQLVLIARDRDRD